MDNVLQACSDELDKIASSKLDQRGKKLKQMGIGAGLGIASTVPFYVPIHAGLHRAGKHKVNIALLGFNILRGAAYGTILGGLLPTRNEIKHRYRKGRLISGSKDDLRKLHNQAKGLLSKTAAFGQNVGKSFGRGSTKGGFSTTFKSAGMGDMKSLTKAMPKLKGTLKATPGIKPPKAIKPERNNQVTLRRGLSNIQIAGGV